MLEEEKELPEDYTQVPHHTIFDKKFEGRHESRLVCSDNETPDAPPEEVCSGVGSMDTIGLAFVLASMNNLEVCTVDISTAFLHGET